MMDIAEKFQKLGVVPVVVLEDTKDAVPLAKALVEGGLSCAEVTFRTEAAEESIRLMTEQFPEMLVGCVTPSEVAQAVKRGLKVVKFFPAEPAGGVAMIKAMAAPYVGIKFMPTGGINAKNLEDYLSFDKIICCGGSWMVKGELVKNGEFDKIRDLTAEARKLVDSIRK